MNTIDYIKFNQYYEISEFPRKNYTGIDHIGCSQLYSVYTATIRPFSDYDEFELFLNKVFLKEIDEISALVYRKLSSVWCPNIAHVYSVHKLANSDIYLNQNKNHTYIAITEYVMGQCLDEYIKNVAKGTLSINDALNLCIQLCYAVKSIHSIGIIHRDIKPANIIIDYDNPQAPLTLKLVDFGCSELLTSKNINSMKPCGTIGFSAPENFESGVSNQRSDIYSIGCILNYMLTGNIPIQKIYTKSFAIRNIIEKSTHHDPYQRYRNVNELEKILKYELSSKPAILRYIPGFRTHTTWKMIFASIVYLAFINEYIFDFITYSQLQFSTIFLTVFWLFLPMIFIFDVLQIKYFLPKHIRKNILIKNIFRIIFVIICIYITYLILIER